LESSNEDLELPEPDFSLNAGSGTHGVQTAKIMVAFEELCQDEKPGLVVVVGPEEINRIVTDSISDYLFVTEESGIKNLLQEGKPEDRIHFVGNVMIDNLFRQTRKIGNGYGLFTVGQDDFNEAFTNLLAVERMCREEYFRRVGV